MKNKSLNYLIPELDSQEFLNIYYGQKIYYLSRKSSSYYENLFSIEKLDYLLNNQIFNSKFLKVSKFGEYLDKKSYSIYDEISDEYQINIGKILELYNQGFTIIIDDIGRYDKNIFNIELDLSNEIGYVKNICSNVYFTPQNSQAFPIHYDIQDVFIIQIYGSKTWNLFPESNNLNPINFDIDQIPNNTKKSTYTLNQGDILYIPRGVYHEVSTNNESSLHITISIINYTYLDVIKGIYSFMSNDKKSNILRMNLKKDINSSSIKEILLKTLKESDINPILKSLKYKNKYCQLVKFDGIISNSIFDKNKKYFIRNNVVIQFNIDKNETLFIYGYKQILIDGDFNFLKKEKKFSINSINILLNNLDVAEELIKFLFIEGFICECEY